MQNLKRFVFALLLVVAAMISTGVPDTAYGEGFCPRGTMYCECQGFVGCAFDCFAACDL
jgi:hypothetical protein